MGRQPFGGWKASSLGPTAKAGGPNYLIGLRRWRDAAPVSVEAAGRSYQEWWDRHFSLAEDVAGLVAESNVLRYRRFAPGVILRLAGDADDDQALKGAAAAEVCGCPLTVSMSGSRPALAAALDRRGARVVAESADALAVRLADRRGSRLRLIGTVEDRGSGGGGRARHDGPRRARLLARPDRARPVAARAVGQPEPAPVRHRGLPLTRAPRPAQISPAT